MKNLIFLFLSLFFCLFTFCKDTGIVVEEVKKNGAGERAGIKEGDLLISWESITKEGKGEFKSIFDFYYFKVEEFPRGEFTIKGIRNRKKISFKLSGAKIGIKVCPNFYDLDKYKKAIDLIKNKDLGKGMMILKEIAISYEKKGDMEKCCWIYLKLSEILKEYNNYKERIKFIEEALSRAEKINNSVAKIEILIEMGEVYEELNYFKEAKESYEKAGEIVKKKFGEKLFLVLIFNNLGIVDWKLGNLSSAEEYLKRSLKIAENIPIESLEVGKSLNVLGIIAHEKGDFNIAEDYYQRALKIREKFAPDSLEVASSLNNLGLLAWNRGNLILAEEYHKKALNIRENLNPNSLDVATSFNNLGNVFYDKGDLISAEEYYKKALEIRENIMSESIDVAVSLNNLGIVARRKGDLKTAEDYYKKALNIYEKITPENLYTAQILTNLGTVAFDKGDLKSAEEYFKRALKIREELAPDSLDVAESFNNLGAIFWSLGNLSFAEEYFKKALKIREKLAPDSIDVAKSLNNLGVVSHERGNFVLAEEYYKRSLKIREKLAPDSLDVASSLNNLGLVAYDRGDLVSAEKYHKRALTIREKIAPESLEVASSFNNLGEVAYDKGDLKIAEEYFKKALKIQEKIAPKSLDVAYSFSNLGIVARDIRDFKTAEDYYKNALKIYENTAPENINVAHSLINLGDVACDKGDLTSAEEYYEKALKIIELLAAGSKLESEVLHNLGILMKKKKQPDKALIYLRKAVDSIEKQMEKLGGRKELKERFSAKYANYYRDLIELELGFKNKEEALNLTERYRSRILLEMIAERDFDFKKDAPEELLLEQKRIIFEYNKLQEEILTLSPERDPEAIEGLLNNMEELRKKQKEIEEQIKISSPKLASLKYPKPLNLKSILSLLDNKELFLSYLISEKKIYLFSILKLKTSYKFEVYEISIDKKKIIQEINFLRYLLRDPLSDKKLLEKKAENLYRILLKPAKREIKKAKVLIICPDGPLHYLPFSVIKISKDKYLVEEKAIINVSSGTVLSEIRNIESNIIDSIIAFGNPLYPKGDKKSYDPFVLAVVKRELSPLPKTKEEVEEIEKLYKPYAKVYTEEKAIEENAKAIGKEIKYLHFACHGILDERFPLNSGLALTIPEKLEEGKENGLLQAWEVFEDIRIKADLVALSACETGLGEEMGGEGLIGLTRAFQYAGAKTILSTLWSVFDESTAILMRNFYSNLKAGKGKAEALRVSQTEMIKSKNYFHPFYWAGFVLNGDWK